MTNKQEIAWSGSDEHGYTGNVDGIALYKIRTELYPRRAPQSKGEYLFLPRRREPHSYGHLDGVSRADTVDEAKTLCEIDFAYDSGRAALHKILGAALLVVEAFGFRVFKPKAPKRKDRVILDDALAVVKAAGFRVSKPKIPRRKNQVGPTFIATFSGNETVRMSTATSAEKLDWGRGERLARHAWASRHKVPLDLDSTELAKMAPSISACRFERDGVVLAQRNGGSAP